MLVTPLAIADLRLGSVPGDKPLETQQAESSLVVPGNSTGYQHSLPVSQARLLLGSRYTQVYLAPPECKSLLVGPRRLVGSGALWHQAEDPPKEEVCLECRVRGIRAERPRLTHKVTRNLIRKHCG